MLYFHLNSRERGRERERERERESTNAFRNALKTARSAYSSSLLEEDKHNPWYLFDTVAKSTRNKASTSEANTL